MRIRRTFWRASTTIRSSNSSTTMSLRLDTTDSRSLKIRHCQKTFQNQESVKFGNFSVESKIEAKHRPCHQMTNIGGRRDLIHGEAQGRGSCPSSCLGPATVKRDSETVQGKTVDSPLRDKWRNVSLGRRSSAPFRHVPSL